MYVFPAHRANRNISILELPFSKYACFPFTVMLKTMIFRDSMQIKLFQFSQMFF